MTTKSAHHKIFEDQVDRYDLNNPKMSGRIHQARLVVKQKEK